MRTVYFDLETGGLDPAHHPIIQVAAVAVDEEWTELETFERKLRFHLAEVDPKALRMNSYDRLTWEKEAVPSRDAADDFSAFLKRYADLPMTSKRGRAYRVARLAGHNAASFDLPFALAWFRGHGMFLPASFQVLDTLQLALWMDQLHGWVRKSYRLESLTEALGTAQEGAHDAMVDVRATVRVSRALQAALREIGGEIRGETQGEIPVDPATWKPYS